MKKLYIWGAGDIGSRILNHLDDNWDIVFVDSNKSLIDKRYCEKRVINIEEYLQNCFNEFVLRLYRTKT